MKKPISNGRETLENRQYSHIIWDWNGTLLDDVFWCIESINQVLKSRNKNTIAGIEAYHKVFGFPIKQYYKNVGFNFDDEPFEVLAQEYISLYHGRGCEKLKLHQGVEKTLDAIRKKNIAQIILSASSKENLLQQIGMFEIEDYFDEVLGIADIYAKSKIDIGLDYMARNNIQRALLIGDTTHDFEVSQALNIDCLLIAKGHQNKKTLLSCGVPVLEDLQDVLRYII